MIAVGCCVGSWDKFCRYVAPFADGHRTIAKSGYPGIVQAYNEILDVAQTWLDLDALILVHDDLEVTDPDAIPKFLAPLEDPDVAMVGVAGGGGRELYWWQYGPTFGHQQTDVRLIDFGPREGDVTLLEGSILVLAPWTVRHLRFDPRFTWFHGYDEIGMQIAAAGKRSVVVDVDTWHHNQEGYTSERSAAECRIANDLYRAKWGLE